MKVMLIMFMTFHYDGGTFGQTVPFANMALCEAARIKLSRQDFRPDGWGRPRLVAVCVEQS